MKKLFYFGLIKKIIIFYFLFLSSLNASMLLDKNYPLCIEDYYYKSGQLYYLRSSDGEWKSIDEDHQAANIHSGYFWDSNNSICIPQSKNDLGLSFSDYNFLMALTGALIGFVFLIASIFIIINWGF